LCVHRSFCEVTVAFHQKEAAVQDSCEEEEVSHEASESSLIPFGSVQSRLSGW
jgi:hypothetical protein